MAQGRPVIAFKGGGALDTIEEGRTGLFFPQPTPDSLATTVRQFEKQVHLFDPKHIQSHAQRFSANRFQRELSKLLQRVYRGELGKTNGGAS